MKKFLVLTAVMLMMMSTAAFADSVSVVSVVGNTVTFQVQNTGAANSVIDNISGFFFTCSGCSGAASVTNSGSGALVNISDAGVISSAGSTTGAGWKVTGSGTYFMSIFNGGPTPQTTIFGDHIGAGNCAGSLCNTGGPHNPFLYTNGTYVTFALSIPGLSSATQLSNLSLWYGTAAPDGPPPPQTPEPASMFLLGTGLLGIGGAIRKKIRL
jgi:hypothetical protein